jgi:hypothetical protein
MLESETRLSHSFLAAIGALIVEWALLEAELLRQMFKPDDDVSTADLHVRNAGPTSGSWILDLYAQRLEEIGFASEVLADVRDHGVPAMRELAAWRTNIMRAAWLPRSLKASPDGPVTGGVLHQDNRMQSLRLRPAEIRKIALTIAEARNAAGKLYNARQNRSGTAQASSDMPT